MNGSSPNLPSDIGIGLSFADVPSRLPYGIQSSPLHGAVSRVVSRLRIPDMQDLDVQSPGDPAGAGPMASTRLTPVVEVPGARIV
jgi:hypothetical protein